MNIVDLEIKKNESPISLYEKNLLEKEAEIVKLEIRARETILKANQVQIGTINNSTITSYDTVSDQKYCDFHSHKNMFYL